MMDLHISPVHVERISHLTDKDLRSLCTLHSTCLPGSLVTHLGLPAISAYYTFILQSPSDHLFIARREDTLVGACMLSDAPDSLTRRFVIARPFTVLPRLALSSITSAPTRRALVDVFKSHELPTQISGLPEVVQIFVDQTCRSAGIGAVLLAEVERFLVGEQTSKYFLKTLADSSNRAIGFYERSGFERLSTVTLSGDDYLFLLKNVRESGHKA